MPLPLEVKGRELYDERTNKFIVIKDTTLMLEHSLVSLHKWEQKWKKPFLKEDTFKTLGAAAFIDYIRCMCMNKVVDDNVFLILSEKNIQDIMAYIDDPMTATWFADDKDDKSFKNKHKKKPIQTAETIYWQMIALQIPKEFEKWHLNSLLTLIRVCGIKNEEQYKESQNGSKTRKPNLKSRAALNAKRRAAMHTKG